MRGYPLSEESLAARKFLSVNSLMKGVTMNESLKRIATPPPWESPPVENIALYFLLAKLTGSECQVSTMKTKSGCA